MTDLIWPDGLLPSSQTYYLRNNTAIFRNTLTNQTQAVAREGTRWVAKLEFKLSQKSAAKLDALLAQLRGPAGTILVPDFRRLVPRLILQSMSAYAEEIGPTFFTDHYDFSDQTNDDKGLALETALYLGTGEPIWLGDTYAMPMLWPYDDADIQLITETADEIWAEGVWVPFGLENGRTLALEWGEVLDFGQEDCPVILTENGETILTQLGGGFYEGDGDCTLTTGSDNGLLITGCAPWVENIIVIGDAIQTSTGRAHLVLDDVQTDINGRGNINIAPILREDVTTQSLKVDQICVRMRLISDDAGDNTTDITRLSSYQLEFEEIL